MKGIEEIENILLKKDEAFLEYLKESKDVVRLISKSIKAVHSSEIEVAKEMLKEAEARIKKLKELASSYSFDLTLVMQEYAEARLLLSGVEGKELPSFKELDVSAEAYILGALDSIGEFKREMYESLRKGNRKEAERYFNIMEDIYDSLLPLRFSNALVKEFRRKQDVARIQIEQARGELI